MPTITVETFIGAPREVCFDLARDVRVHEQTTVASKERVVAVVRDGTECAATLLELGDEVTFEATHLGVRQRLTSRIVAFDPPHNVIDEMQKGAFKSLRHIHRFELATGGTTMTDVLEFESPLGILGRTADKLFVVSYMRNFISQRAIELKRLAESRYSES
jgi:ligand-binding SRPBCC domain-containing protein